MIKITTRLQFVCASRITVSPSLLQNAVTRIEIPAEPIIATTAGRREWRIPWSIAISRYFKYSFASSVTRIHDGRIHPNVATSAPGMPAILIPTKVAELTAIGPGVIWEMVTRSVNSDIDSQPCPCTTCP